MQILESKYFSFGVQLVLDTSFSLCFCIPEMNGLSLEQIDILYVNTTSIHSALYCKMLLTYNIWAIDVEGGKVNVDALHRRGRAGSEEFRNDKIVTMRRD